QGILTHENKGSIGHNLPASRQRSGRAGESLRSYVQRAAEPWAPRLAVSIRPCFRRPNYEPTLTALPTLVKVALALEPSVLMAVMQTTIIRASMTAYSTAVGPSSRLTKLTRCCVNLRIERSLPKRFRHYESETRWPDTNCRPT